MKYMLTVNVKRSMVFIVGRKTKPKTLMKITKEQTQAAIGATLAIADAIKQLQTVPSGKIYAMVCGFMSLDQYQALLRILINAKLVHQDCTHLLHWIGPVSSATVNA